MADSELLRQLLVELQALAKGQSVTRDRWLNRLIEDPRIDPSARHVASRMRHWANLDNEAEITIRQLQRETGYAKDTALYAVHRLLDAGWLELVYAGVGRRPSIYLLTFPDRDGK